MNTKLLQKTSKETQLLIKSEGERNLEDIHKSEDIMTNKINNILSFSFAVFIGVISYSVKCISDKKFDLLFILSLLLSVVFGLVIFILFKSIFPLENRLLGSQPNKLVQNDLIKGDDYDELRIISNRILCTQKAIDISITSYIKRLESYKKANKILIFGLLISLTIIIIIFLLCQFSC